MHGDAYPGDEWTPCRDGGGRCEPEHCPLAGVCDEQEDDEQTSCVYGDEHPGDYWSQRREALR